MENKRIDIHNYKKRYERILERIKESKEISNENKKILFEFKDNCILQGLGYPKIERYLHDAVKFSLLLKKSISKATKEEIKKVVLIIEQKDLAEETKKCIQINYSKNG